jgi:hypothetical protein
MTLTISPELEEKIAAQARERGVSADRYAAELLAREYAPQPVSISDTSAEELLQGLRELAETATPIKNYPEDFFSREVIYADHD